MMSFLYSTGQEKLSRLVEKPFFNDNYDVLWFAEDNSEWQSVEGCRSDFRVYRDVHFLDTSPFRPSVQ